MTFFEELHRDADSRARLGVLHTDHGDLRTPAFMPVGTQASVKSLDVRDLIEVGSDIILNNTYHLHLRPGEDAIAGFGGAHQFQGWHKPILTDSGGFQVFSLGQKGGLVAIDEDGVTFRSHIDGSKHRFTPEEAIRIQQKIGADIIMAFDQCTADGVSYDMAKRAMERTHAWAARCVAAQRQRGPHSWRQFLFGIIQGAFFEDLRRASAAAICAMDVDGIAIGGESIGYHMGHTKQILKWIEDMLPADTPRYTMGVGASPLDVLDVVEHGIDMFDCVVPTRMARHGTVFSRSAGAAANYRMSLKRAGSADDARPLCDWCRCRYCRGDEHGPPVSRRYVHHLFRAREMLAARIATYHNLFFMEQFMGEVRAAIKDDGFGVFAQQWRMGGIRN